MKALVFASLAVLSLAACDTKTVVTHDPSGQLGICPAPAFQEFVGQPYANTKIEWPDLRIIRPGDAVTKDYVENRLNVDLDAAEVITRIWCG